MSIQNANTQQGVLPPLKDILSPKYIFGYNGSFKNNIFLHLDPARTIYPAGNCIAIYNADNRNQSFLHPFPGTCLITTMTMSQNRGYLAWAEESETGIIVVYDLKTNKKKILTSVDSGSRSYISLSFSRDETKGILYSLTGPPDWNLIIWDWNKAKILSNTKLIGVSKVYSCFCHFKEDDQVGLLGYNMFKIYKLMPDNSLKLKDPLMSKKEAKDLGHSQNFLSYCLLKDDNLIIGTDQGELLLFNNNWEYKSVLSGSPNDGYPIEVMLAYARGFLVAGVNGCIYQYEKHEGDIKTPYLRLDKKIQNKDIRSRITSLMLTSGDENLVIGTEDGHLFQVPFSREMNDDKFDPTVFGLYFHSNKITGLDVCIRKALVATCSLDKTVRVWNYSDPTIDYLSKEYDDEALAIGFHPSGFHLVVAFNDKIRMINIFDKDLVTFREINVKGCREISFCNGGHLFAVANTNIIMVYQFYTGENPNNYVFRGHTGRVVSIVWLENDLSFLSASNDGTIYEFRLEENTAKPPLFNNTNFQITSIACSNDKTIYIAGNDANANLPEEKHILEIKYSTKEVKDHENIMNEKKMTVSEPIKIFTGSIISQVLFSKSNKLLFYGTEEKDYPGSVRVTRYPLTPEVLEYQTHNKGISRLKITFDDNYIFSAGNDGSLIIYEVKEKDSKKKDKENMAMEEFADEFLIPKEIYSSKIRQIENLKADIDKLRLKNELETKIELKEKDEKIKLLNDKLESESENDRIRYERLLKAKEEMQIEYEDKKRTLKERHELTKKTIESDYKEKIALEIMRYEDLEKEKAREKKEFDIFLQENEETHLREISELQSNYEVQLMRDRMLRDRIFAEKEELLANFNKQSSLLEEKAEEEIEKIKEQNEEKIKKIREQMEKALAEKNAKKGILDSEAQKLEDRKTKLKEIVEDIEQIKEAKKQLTKEKEAHAKEIEERDKTIKDKYRRIQELKKKTQELEKFKFVLDYKIKELKRNIGPREEEIAKMKEQIANMNAEILHFKRTNDNLWLIVKDLRFRQKGMKKEIEGLEKIIIKNDNYIKSFETEVSECYQSIGNFKLLKKRILGLYNKYVQNEKKKLEIAVDLQAEFINQREHLETNVKSLKQKFEKNMVAHLQDNKRIMKENVDLIKEINDLRREMKFLQDDTNKKQSQTTQSLNKKKNLYQIENKDEIIDLQQEELIALQERFKELTVENEKLKEKRLNSAKKLPALTS